MINLRYLLLPLLAWVIAQGSKVIVHSIKEKRLNLRVLATMGGMPSSHSAMVMALTTAIGRVQHVDSPIFAVAVIFSFVVMYDAAGVRHAAGRQAALLNRMVEDLMAHRDMGEERLRELLGHTPIEVVAGATLGIAIGLLPI